MDRRVCVVRVVVSFIVALSVVGTKKRNFTRKEGVGDLAR